MEDLTKTAFISFSKIIIFKMEFFQTEFPVFFENQVSWTMGFSFQLAHFSCVHSEWYILQSNYTLSLNFQLRILHF